MSKHIDLCYRPSPDTVIVFESFMCVVSLAVSLIREEHFTFIIVEGKQIITTFTTILACTSAYQEVSGRLPVEVNVRMR